MSTVSLRICNSIARLVSFAAMAWLLSTGAAWAAETFEKAELRLDQNLNDKDIEVTFDVLTRKRGLAALRVTAPDGRVVIDFKSPNSKFGIRSLTLETPEPTNDGKLQADFPEGVYRFDGSTTNGDKLQATATLNHALPPAPQGIIPRHEQEDVPIVGVKVSWKPIPGIAQFLLTLENEKSGREITSILPGTINVFSVPAGFLVAGAQYKVEVGSVGKNGNRTFVEHEFSTVKRR